MALARHRTPVTRTPPLYAPLTDAAYAAAAAAVRDHLAAGDRVTPFGLSAAAATASAPYVQRDILRRALATSNHRANRFALTQCGASAVGFVLAIGYACHVGSWALALLELALFVVMLNGASYMARLFQAEQAAGATLLHLDG